MHVDNYVINIYHYHSILHQMIGLHSFFRKSMNPDYCKEEPFWMYFILF